MVNSYAISVLFLLFFFPYLLMFHLRHSQDSIDFYLIFIFLTLVVFLVCIIENLTPISEYLYLFDYFIFN